MLIHCSTCNTLHECKLAKGTKDVICTDCGNKVEGISPFTINSMESRKDYLENARKAFEFPCEACKVHTPGILSEDQKSVICSICSTTMNTTQFMISTLREIEKIPKE